MKTSNGHPRNKRAVAGHKLRDQYVLYATFTHDIANLFHAMQFLTNENEITETDQLKLRELARKGAKYIQFVRNYMQLGEYPHNEPVAIADIVNAAVDEIELFAATSGVRILRDDLSGTLHHVDPAILREAILGNLLYNAVKFTPPGKNVRVGSRITKTHVAILITDEGPGMPKDLAERIGDAREVIPSPGARGEIGSGIGLVLTHRLTERMEGKLSFVTPFTIEGGTQAVLEWRN
ncbi:MAG: sensor histidine kinase [bacterium]|nr:sensor histidine kinase [bacterium]